MFKAIPVMSIAAAMAVVASFAQADPKPQNAKRADNQAVANFYGGSAREWSSCNGGGVYFGAGWEAIAFCGKNPKSVGIGKWSVKKGVICHELVWYWKDNDEIKSKKNAADCIAHIVDAEGTMWRRWNDDADWWRVQDIKSDKNASKRFKHQSKFNRAKKKIGL